MSVKNLAMIFAPTFSPSMHNIGQATVIVELLVANAKFIFEPEPLVPEVETQSHSTIEEAPEETSEVSTVTSKEAPKESTAAAEGGSGHEPTSGDKAADSPEGQGAGAVEPDKTVRDADAVSDSLSRLEGRVPPRVPSSRPESMFDRLDILPPEDTHGNGRPISLADFRCSDDTLGNSRPLSFHSALSAH
jgi:hypothetical protein